MQEVDVGLALHDAVMVALKLGAPPLLAALCIGLVISLVQAVTQINEATLAFVPKVVVIGAVLALLGPFMLATLSGFTQGLFDRMIVVGSQ